MMAREGEEEFDASVAQLDRASDFGASTPEASDLHKYNRIKAPHASKTLTKQLGCHFHAMAGVHCYGKIHTLRLQKGTAERE